LLRIYIISKFYSSSVHLVPSFTPPYSCPKHASVASHGRPSLFRVNPPTRYLADGQRRALEWRVPVDPGRHPLQWVTRCTTTGTTGATSVLSTTAGPHDDVVGAGFLIHRRLDPILDDHDHSPPSTPRRSSVGTGSHGHHVIFPVGYDVVTRRRQLLSLYIFTRQRKDRKQLQLGDEEHK